LKKRRKIRIAILVILAIVLTTVILRGQGGGPEIAPGSTLVLDVEGRYVEAPRSSIVARLFGEESKPFVGLLSRFAMAHRDDRLGTVVVVVRPLDIGWGKAGEIRDAITRLREAGRHTVAYLEIASFSASREYYIASAADEIYMIPGGTVPVVGLAAEYVFLGGLWEKLGITFEVGKAGRYKSAVESYAGKGMSEASAEMANSLLDDTHEAFVAGIAEGRGLEREQVLEIIEKGPMVASELEALGLVDGSRHLDTLLDEIGGEVVLQSRYASVDPSEVGFDPVARVALVYGTGNVVHGRGSRSPSGGQVFASKTASKAILEAAEDESIDAIILRIDSPGGSALAAEEIWRALQKAREEGKPIIASFSDLAASGGYYVAVGADAIVSAPGTLTGSIGVFALRPVLGGALERLGVNTQSLKRGRYSDFLLAGEPLSEPTRLRLQAIVLDTYQLFLERVASGRDLTTADVDRVAQGRVWTGRQAWEKGLVDELGGLHTAVKRVRRHLELDEDADVALVPFPAPRTLAQELASVLDSRVAEIARAQLPIPASLRHIEGWLTELPPHSPLLIPPMLVEIR
jgi:protease-4